MPLETDALPQYSRPSPQSAIVQDDWKVSTGNLIQTVASPTASPLVSRSQKRPHDMVRSKEPMRAYSPSLSADGSSAGTSGMWQSLHVFFSAPPSHRDLTLTIDYALPPALFRKCRCVLLMTTRQNKAVFCTGFNMSAPCALGSSRMDVCVSQSSRLVGASISQLVTSFPSGASSTCTVRWHTKHEIPSFAGGVPISSSWSPDRINRKVGRSDYGPAQNRPDSIVFTLEPPYTRVYVRVGSSMPVSTRPARKSRMTRLHAEPLN